MTLFRDERKAQEEEANQDLAQMLINRLKYYVGSDSNKISKFFKIRHHLEFCTALIKLITPLLKKNVSDAGDKGDKKSDKKEENNSTLDVPIVSDKKNEKEEKSDFSLVDPIIIETQKSNYALHQLLRGLATVNPTTIHPNGLFAAILGAFISLHPQYAPYFPTGIRDQLPDENEWRFSPDIRKNYQMMRMDFCNFTTHGKSAEDSFTALTQSDQRAIAYSYFNEFILSWDKIDCEILMYKIRETFSYYEQDQSTQMVEMLLQISKINKENKLARLIKLLHIIYPFIQSENEQESVRAIFSDSLNNNCNAVFKAALEAMINATTCLTYPYDNLQRDFNFCLEKSGITKFKKETHADNNFCLEATERHAVGIAANLYRHTNDAYASNRFFNSLMAIVQKEKWGVPDRALATIYPYLSNDQKNEFLKKIYSAKRESFQYEIFATIYPYIAENEPSLEEKESSIQDSFTAFEKELITFIQTGINYSDLFIVLKIFRHLNEEYRKVIYNVMLKLLNTAMSGSYGEIYICKVLTKLAPQLVKGEIDRLITALLPLCTEESSDERYKLLANLLPFSQNDPQKKEALELFKKCVTKKLDQQKFDSLDSVIIDCLPLTDQLELAKNYMRAIRNPHIKNYGPLPPLFYNVATIFYNATRGKVPTNKAAREIINEELASTLPPPVRNIISGYLDLPVSGRIRYNKH